MTKPILKCLAIIALAVATCSVAHARGFMPAVDHNVGKQPVSAAVADFNGDGIADLAVANYKTNNVSVLIGKRNGGFQHRFNFSVGSVPISVGTGDFNGDGRPDIVVVNAVDHTVSILLNIGFGFKKAANQRTGGLSPVAMVVGDFNKDGKLDVAVLNECIDKNCDSGTVGVLLGKGDGSFHAAKTYGAGMRPESLAAGDLNADGTLDLVVADFVQNLSILLGNGDGTFQAATTFDLSEIPGSVVLADLNKDGILDLAVTDALSNVSVMLGNGDGTFQSPVDYPVGPAPESIAVADFNGDGNVDLAVSVSTEKAGKVKILLGNGDGTFRIKWHMEVGLGPSSLVAADFNRDHAPDLVTTGFEGTSVSVLMNSGGTMVKDVSSANPSQFGQPVTLTATVTPSFQSVGTPTGLINFYDGATLLAKVPLDNTGQASFTTSDLTVGTHSIRTHYSGDTNFNPNHGKALSQVVQ